MGILALARNVVFGVRMVLKTKPNGRIGWRYEFTASGNVVFVNGCVFSTPIRNGADGLSYFGKW